MWEEIESALTAWVRASTSLPEGQILFADQHNPRPAGEFITVRLGGLTMVGAVDPVVYEYDSNRVAGTELEERVEGTRRLRVSLQAFSRLATGEGCARSLLAQCQTALGLPSVRDALYLAGLSPYDAGNVQAIPGVIDTRTEGRAVLDVGFYCVQTLSAYTTYIEHVVTENYMGPPDLGTADEIDI
jgi:hypothetical protein